MTMRQRPLPFGLYILLVLLVPAMSNEGAETDAAALPPDAAVRTAVQWKPEQFCLGVQDEHPWWTFPVTARFSPNGQSIVSIVSCWRTRRILVTREPILGRSMRTNRLSLLE